MNRHHGEHGLRPTISASVATLMAMAIHAGCGSSAITTQGTGGAGGNSQPGGTSGGVAAGGGTDGGAGMGGSSSAPAGNGGFVIGGWAGDGLGGQGLGGYGGGTGGTGGTRSTGGWAGMAGAGGATGLGGTVTEYWGGAGGSAGAGGFVVGGWAGTGGPAGAGGFVVGGWAGDGLGGQIQGGRGGGLGGAGGNNWTDPNCYMRCGQGNAIYYGGAGGRGGAGGAGGIFIGGGSGQVQGGAGGGGGMAGAGGTVSPVDGGGDDCSMALPINCGDQVNHSTLVQGRGNVWEDYNASQRVFSGPETLYAFRSANSCQVLATLTADDAHPASGELVLFLFTGCGMRWNTSAGLQASFAAQAGQTYYLVVDGVNGAAGSYYLRVECTAGS